MLRVEDICKKAGAFRLKNICMEVEKASYHVLLGPSGSGKTMLMEIIAGISRADSGKIFLDNRDVTEIRPGGRKTGMVYQYALLFDHLTVRQNIAYSSFMRSKTAAFRTAETGRIASELHITELLDRHPSKLSGGEKQRVALARALVMQPSVLLLDEPLSSLDVMLRDELISILLGLKEKGQTILHITHRYEEALTLADRLTVIHEGEVIQHGSPGDVFANPVSLFTAKFAGHPNCFQAEELIAEGETWFCRIGLWNLQLPFKPLRGKGFVVIHPEEIYLETEDFCGDFVNLFPCRLISIRRTDHITALVKLDTGQTLTVTDTGNGNVSAALKEGERLCCYIPPSAAEYFSGS